jgi:hypothetical protein
MDAVWVRARRSSRRWAIRRTDVLVVLALVLVAPLFAVAPARAADDTTPPQIISFSMTPALVNTETADQTVTVTMTVTDDQSGVTAQRNPGTTMEMGSAAAFTQQVNCSFNRVSGDALNGVYSGTFTLPAGGATGSWQVLYLRLADNVGNFVDLQAGQLEAMFGAGCTLVTNVAANSDATPPQITSFSMTPAQVNTETAEQAVTVTVTLTDAQAGVSSQGDSGALAVPSEMQLVPATVGTQSVQCFLTRVSGDDHNGVYTGTFTLLAGSHTGRWKVNYLNLRDKLENRVALNASDLEAKFGAGSAEVDNLAANADTTPPQMTAFSLTPLEFNTESAGQTLTATVTLTDDQSGVRLQDEPWPYVQMSLAPLIGTQSATVNFTRVSGDNLHGVYTGRVTLPVGAKEGIWSVQGLQLVDRVGNLSWLTADDVESRLPSAEGLTVVNTATAQQVTIDRAWTLAGPSSSVTFPAGTVVTRADDGRFAFYEMTAQEFTLDDSVPTTNLDGVPLATVRFGIPGLNLSFSQAVTVSMQVGLQYDGYLLDVQSLTEGGEAWANEATCEVVGGRIQFTVNHATRFAASVAAPTISGFTPAVGPTGSKVTVTGKGLHGATQVTFNAAPATFRVDSSTSITATVPAGATSGSIAITTPGGSANSIDSFTVATPAPTPIPGRPTLTKLSPTSARRGITVTITGKNFGKRSAASYVKFGATRVGKYVSWSSTHIKCKVPAKAKFGRLQVKVITAGGTSSGKAFTVKR